MATSSKVQTQTEREIAKISDQIAQEKLKQAKSKLEGEKHNTRKTETAVTRAKVSADIEAIKLQGDYQLESQATLALEKLQVQTGLAANDLAMAQQQLGASDTRVRINDAMLKAQLVSESVKLAETELEASNLLASYKELYGETPKLSQSKVSVVAPTTINTQVKTQSKVS